MPVRERSLAKPAVAPEDDTGALLRYWPGGIGAVKRRPQRGSSAALCYHSVIL
jgi:hypothetical protein